MITVANSVLRHYPAWLTASLRCSTHHVFSRKLTSPAPKPFKDMPGPKGYPLIGTALDYRNDKFTAYRVMAKRLAEYGPVYREKMIPGMPEQVVVFRPEDVEAVFRADSEWPNRPEGGEVTHLLFKESGVNVYGVLSSQGEQWHKMRSPMSKFMMVPRKVAEYHEDFNNITLDLLKNVEMKKHPDTSVLTDVPSHFFNWSFECEFTVINTYLSGIDLQSPAVGYFTLGKRLGALSASGGTTPESQEFIHAVNDLFESIMDLFLSIPTYRLYRNKKWKHTVNANRQVHTLARQFINEKLAEIEEGDRKALEAASGEEEAPDKVDFITYLVHSGKMSIEEVSVNLVDLLSAGVETTSYTLGWALYLLANNPEAQEKLRNEIQSVIGSDQIVTPAHINEMSYLRNVLKETQRLYPLAVMNQRKLQNDAVVSGYLVPEGTEILMPQIITGRTAEFYPEPEKFLPERWSKDNKQNLPSSFANLPFGFGPRMCVGRRVAELELYIAISHLIREYKVEYLDKEPIGHVMAALLKPDRHLDLAFKKA